MASRTNWEGYWWGTYVAWGRKIWFGERGYDSLIVMETGRDLQLFQ